jgi:hypothetical protein
MDMLCALDFASGTPGSAEAVPIFLPRVSAAGAGRTPPGHSYYFGTTGSNPSLWAVQTIGMPYSRYLHHHHLPRDPKPHFF